jgi:membrane fusion protein (multidrug efflux system)
MKKERTIAQRLKEKKLLSVTVLMLLLLSLFWFFQQREPKKTLVQKPLDLIPVTVAPVSKSAVRDSFSTVGTVEAFREADIFSESAGQVRKVSAEPGSHKKTGDALFIVDDELAASRQRKADAHYRQTKRDVERYKTLYAEGAVPLSAFEAVQLQNEEAQAEFIAATRKFSDTKVKAPFTGTVTSRFVEQGELLHEGGKVAHMVDMTKVKIIIFVPEREIIKFVPGTMLTVTSDTYPGQRFDGKVSAVSDKSSRDHSYRVEVLLQNPQKTAFRSGMFARVVTTGEGHREALLVPRIALVSGIRKPEVFVVRNGKAVLTPFIAGMELQKELEVLDGLKIGESVVTSGQTELLNGSAVLVIGQKKGQTAP